MNHLGDLGIGLNYARLHYLHVFLDLLLVALHLLNSKTSECFVDFLLFSIDSFNWFIHFLNLVPLSDWHASTSSWWRSLSFNVSAQGVPSDALHILINLCGQDVHLLLENFIIDLALNLSLFSIELTVFSILSQLDLLECMDVLDDLIMVSSLLLLLILFECIQTIDCVKQAASLGS